MSRIQNATRNIFFGYIGSMITILLGFLSRTVFIYTLGVTYLGINGLYTNLLSTLSLAELGIGTAMNYSLYKPVAKQDLEKIKALMNLYRKAYLGIAFIITISGLVLVPFLKYIIKDPGDISINDLTIYYLIFLFNTVSTYFVSYKYSLVNAEQKGYIQTNINTVTSIINAIAQVVILLIYKNFLLSLLVTGAIGLVQKIYVNIYLNKLYPYLLDKNIRKLSKEEVKPIKTNIKALIYHKFGEVSIYQTDNIIISTFINVTTVGLISNYNLIITSINGFTNAIFNSVISGFGNLIATESKAKQYYIFKIYRFMGFWVFGFSSIAFAILLSPFISLWIGEDMILPKSVIYLIVINYYFMGERVIVNNFKTAAGVFDQDKYISIIESVVNLVLSVILVKIMGLEGVYIGTICSGLVASSTRPYIVCRTVFNINVSEYYKDSLFYALTVLLSFLILDFIKTKVFIYNTIITFVVMIIFVILIPNMMFFIIYRKKEEFKYVLEHLTLIVHKLKLRNVR